MSTPPRIRLRLSIGLILSLSLVILVLIPALMLRILVRETAHKAVETEVLRLNLGILDASRQSLGDRLQHLDLGFPAPAVLDAGPRVQLAYRDLPLGESYLIPLSASPGAATYRLVAQDPATPSGGKVVYALSALDFQPDYRSQTFALLRENPERRLWMGQLPFLPQAGTGFWEVGLVQWGTTQAILVLSLDAAYLEGFLTRLARSVESTMYLVSADNVVLHGGQADFFAQPWAAKALSRTREGTFFSFVSDQGAGTTESAVLVHVYADPKYLYNLVAVTPQASLSRPVDRVIDQTTIITGIVAGFFGFLTLGLVVLLTRHLRRLTQQVVHISNGDYAPLTKSRFLTLAETDRIAQGIGDLALRLQENHREIDENQRSLEQRVAERTASLRSTLHELQEAQDMLVQTEKMAALGRTVAAFTHEINNPLGASVTAVTKLLDTVHELQTAYREKTLSNSAFSQGLDLIGEAASMINHNLERATAITGSFKHVAVDQSHTEVREFNLHEYCTEISLTLQPLLKRGVHSLRLKIDPRIQVTGNPAVFYQIISNLVINSLKHGFEGRSVGVITISAEQAGPQVCLEYRDDGMGMNAEQLSRLYEPFFTTKRGEGGTGLGMSIVYNLVYDELRGTIQCESEPGGGVHFTVCFPAAPGPEEA